MLDLGYDGQDLVYDKIKQTLRVDRAGALPAEHDADNRPQRLYKLIAVILSIVEF